MRETSDAAVAAQVAPLVLSRSATWCLAIFLAAAAFEVVPIVAAKIALAPLPKVAGESYAFTLIIAFSIMAGLALQLVSMVVSLYAARRGRWKDPFAYIALACNAVMLVLFLSL
jgi:hypothetical protein